ncbi:hypothetical protein HK405_008342, partial [Cladochytrium tenue]
VSCPAPTLFSSQVRLRRLPKLRRLLHPTSQTTSAFAAACASPTSYRNPRAARFSGGSSVPRTRRTTHTRPMLLHRALPSC